MAAQAETMPDIFHSPNCYVAFNQSREFQADSGLRNDNHALQVLTWSERLSGDAIESFAAEIFRSALNRRSAGLPEQTHGPMQ